MPNKLKANFTVDIEKVLERVKSYPYIYKVIQTQLENLSQFKQPPLVEQVHPIVYWLHRFTDTSRRLLNELEQALIKIERSEIKNKEEFLKKLRMAKDEPSFRSPYSELYLAKFFVKSGIELLEFEPRTKDGKNKADFRICLDVTNVMVELITPGELSDDFEEKEIFLFEKLERVQSGGLLVDITGFESYDSLDLWQTRVEAPTYKHVEEIVAGFRKFASNISEEELPKEFPTLCPSYPRIKIIARERKPNYAYTFVTSSSSRTGEGFPIYRIVNMILDERKHLSSDDFNFVFVDFNYWSRIERHFLDSPVHREMLIKELKKNISSRIDGVFTYIVSNQDDKLINRRILWLNSNKPEFNKSEVQRFLKFWESVN